MAYEFGNRLAESTAANQNRNAGVYTRTLIGQTIRETPVPVWTAEAAQHPFVTFEDPSTRKRIGISKDMLSYGFLTLAEPGGGKTNLLNMITRQLLVSQEKGDKIIIFDTKGDYYREFGDRIPKKDCIVVGAGSEYAGLTGCHNLFAEIMPRANNGRLVYTPDSDSDALEKAKQLFSGMQSESQPIFPAMAEQIVAGLLIYFMRRYWMSEPEKLNNEAFIRFVTASTNAELKAVFELDYMKDYRNCISYIAGTNNQTQGVSSYIGTVLRELFIGPFAKHDSGREFSMREVVDAADRKVVFVEYDLRRGKTLAPMYGLLMDSALANALGGRNTARNNVYFIWDEMLLLPKLTHFSDGLNFGRSQGVKILCGLQNFSSLADIYEEIGAKRVLSSFQNIVAFHNADYDTRCFLMNRFGANYQNLSFSSQQSNIHTQREGHTVEDNDILSLGLGEAIVRLKNEAPFFFQMPRYH